MGLFYGGFAGYGLYLLFSLPALLFGLWAQSKVQGAFKKYSKVRTYTGLTGAQVARRMLGFTWIERRTRRTNNRLFE